ncbi:hypothetical protein QQF64_014551 [Cirrhinus molitorella]|uniref:Uncharacterized protein n=1 Tax=Cirrhinus molitorella TaxID=172907 RepID=A0ABR3NTL4_9TELE
MQGYYAGENECGLHRHCRLLNLSSWWHRDSNPPSSDTTGVVVLAVNAIQPLLLKTIHWVLPPPPPWTFLVCLLLVVQLPPDPLPAPVYHPFAISSSSLAPQCEVAPLGGGCSVKRTLHMDWFSVCTVFPCLVV